MQKVINGTMLRKMLIGGSALLEENKAYVDSLNVFPVPDGDTGTNMSLTMKSVVTEVNNCSNNNIDEISEAFTKGALKGARGNSGVILSQILKGIGSVFKNETEINAKVFAKALNIGAEVAYKAVTKPKEGTILTVVRTMAESATKYAKKNIDVDEFLKQVINAGEEALQKTPELLPVLKKAGVVDSGGRGLIIIFTGLYKVLINDESLNIDYSQISGNKDSLNVDFGGENPANIQDLGDIQFAYCTEYFIIEIKMQGFIQYFYGCYRLIVYYGSFKIMIFLYFEFFSAFRKELIRVILCKLILCALCCLFCLRNSNFDFSV